jgi:hypothetical protein
MQQQKLRVATTGPAEPPPTRSRKTQDHRHDGSGEEVYKLPLKRKLLG